MTPLTLSSGEVPELADIADATPLECMLVALACPIMRVVRHRSGSLLYQNHCVNFLQGFDSFFGTIAIPRRASNTPFFVIIRRGANNEAREVRVRRHVVLKLASYLIDNNPKYRGLHLGRDALNELPEDGPLTGVIVYVDEEDDANEHNADANEAAGSKETTIALPQLQRTEESAIEERS